MEIDLINTFIKFIGLNLVTCISYCKIINIKLFNKLNSILILFTFIILSIIESSIFINVSSIVKIIISYLSYSIIFKFFCKTRFNLSLIITAVSICFSYVAYFVASFFVSLILSFVTNINYKNPLFSLIILVVQISILLLFFKCKRFKNGIPFFKDISENSNIIYFLNIFILFFNIIIFTLYLLMQNISQSFFKYFVLNFSLSIIILIAILLESYIIYHKQKLQLQALKSYEQELSETKEKLAIAIEEKQKLIKSNHEFYHRQESLNKKLDDLMKQNKLSSNLNMNTEFAEDYSDILERINKLSDEYKAKTATIPNLEKTGITEIDDMLSYMQSECIKSNIEFNLKINCDVHYMIEKLISVSQLETLLGDLIRNSIIAINHSSKDFRSILVVFGIKDKIYELCVFDSGIPFEIDTLLNLGIKPASTHLDEGGSGIGFVTTFETMDSCNSSFVINEITNNNYTKSLEIKFDNLNEYIVVSDRKDEIAKKNAINKRNDIILK